MFHFACKRLLVNMPSVPSTSILIFIYIDINYLNVMYTTSNILSPLGL